jgi:hypothetical protein
MTEQQLRQAAANGNLERVKELYANGADPYASGAESGKTALHRAAENGRLEIVVFLLSLDAPINCMDINGDTPLNSAIQSKTSSLVEKIAVIKCLIHAKADILAYNSAGKTPFMNFDIIRYHDELLLKPHLQNEVRQIIRKMKHIIAEKAMEQELSASIRPNGEVVFGDAEALLNDRNTYQLPNSGQININVLEFDKDPSSINLAPHR